ncbi:MAG: hypothetical protein IT378_10845 [Sandaracinaceae bacterium]|nr:hypothetical protein [Sandaracinaceae bacterium]
MDESTEGVTLYAGFVFDVVNEYRSMGRACAPLFEMVQHLDPNDPTRQVPMQLYNDVCAWVERSFGRANIRDAGRAIGKRAFDQMVKDGVIKAGITPPEILEQLKRVASIMIQDPKGRGWEILESADRRVVMRRTQTFNCPLQEGLLVSLVERAGATLPRVAHSKCARQGAEFCDYEVTWTGRARPHH